MLVILHSWVLLFLVRSEVLVLLEPAKVHGVPLFVPSLLQELRRSLSSRALAVLVQLSHCRLLIVIEDAVASPNAANAIIEIFRLPKVIVPNRFLDLGLPLPRFCFLYRLFSLRGVLGFLEFLSGDFLSESIDPFLQDGLELLLILFEFPILLVLANKLFFLLIQLFLEVCHPIYRSVSLQDRLAPNGLLIVIFLKSECIHHRRIVSAHMRFQRCPEVARVANLHSVQCRTVDKLVIKRVKRLTRA